MSLFDDLFSTKMPRWNDSPEWTSVSQPVLSVTGEDGAVRHLMTFHISEVIEETGKLTIRMASGTHYVFNSPRAIKTIRAELVKAGIIP